MTRKSAIKCAARVFLSIIAFLFFAVIVAVFSPFLIMERIHRG